jgi:hypothetical protein
MALMEEQLPTDGQQQSAAPKNAVRLADHPRFPLLALAGIFVLSWVVWAWVGSKHAYPNIFADEMSYGKMSQNFAAGDGLQWRGTNGGLPPVWPLLLSIGWHFGSTPDAWELQKVVCAGLASAVVFPVWLLARSYVGERRALIAAGFAVVGAWMAVTPFIVSENLAYPLATASLVCLVAALRGVSMRWLAIGLVFAAIACLTRTQMLSLPVIFVLALLLDVVRHPKGKRRARFEAWPRALWIVLGGAVAALLLAFILKPGLTNYDILSHHASIGKIVSTTFRHVAVSIVAFAFIPVMAFFGLALDRRNWRDDSVGPLLVTTLAAALVMFPLLGRFESWATLGAPVERYTMYLAPLLGIVLVVAPGRLMLGRTAIGGLIMLGLLLAVPHFLNQLEQPGLYGIQHRFEVLGGYLGDHLKLAVFVVAIPVAIAGALALNARGRAATGFATALVIVAAVAIVESSTYHNALTADERLGRPLIAPKTLDWVDRAAEGDVALLAVNKGEPMHQNPDLYTEFFNKKIKTLYSTQPIGAGECVLKLKPHGVFTQVPSAACVTFPRNYVIVEGAAHLTLRDQQVVATSPRNGWLVKVPPGAPKVFSVVKPPCSVNGCDGVLQLGLYLTDNATVAVTFGKSPNDHRVQTASRIQDLPADKQSTLRFDVPKGDQAVSLPVDWNTPDGPPLESVLVNTGGKTVRVY